MSNLPQAAHIGSRSDPWRQQRHDARFTLLLGALSIGALLFYYIKQQLLLYGDAVAHINIARRVVDNRHPWLSLSELGTVWLPLQHIAMLPFVWLSTLWQSGIAGAIPGMLAFVLGTLGVYRLVKAHGGQLAGYLAAPPLATLFKTCRLSEREHDVSPGIASECDPGARLPRPPRGV